MAKEKTEELDKKEVEVRKKAIEKVITYFKLSTLLFGMGDKSPYDINEIKEDNEFYKPAKALAAELKIDWGKMTHEESNRIMLSLLDDYFNQINVDGDYKFTLLVNIEKKKK